MYTEKRKAKAKVTTYMHPQSCAMLNDMCVVTGGGCYTIVSVFSFVQPFII